ncbi:conserved hypothetical protein [Ricinus communis]|uniref:Disease resistance protein At4g27190-like leucine-rich repeats domain-containing protein n=1 Tax=Ricinus communis TaxID=3988 RepID=B9S722_RICCO|nr:conserved hypothetical protein [Ricinus communis]
MVKLLVKLEKVTVDRCDGIEAIVAEEEESYDKIIFPQLRFLELTCLTELKSFCIERSTKVEFPLLEHLILNDVDVIVEEKKGRTRKRKGNHHGVLLSGKKNKDGCCHNYSHTERYCPFSIRFIERMQNLKKLKLKYCSSLKVIFLFEESPANGVLFNNLEELELEYLLNLKHVWHTIPPESTAFENLKELNVYLCHRLKHLFSPLMAKYLVKLEAVRITCCHLMEVIVAEEKLEGEVRSEKVIFPQLRLLRLESLFNLESFSIDSSIIIEFPSLEHLYLIECYRMETFSYGLVAAPKLKKIDVEDHELKRI